jgi:hypothetical protein
MKYGSIKAVCLIVLAFITVLSAYGDERNSDLNAIVLEHFSNETAHEWLEGRTPRTSEFSWTMSASKFATKSTDSDGKEVSYPQMAYVETWPLALYGYNREGRDIKSLGIHGKFDRKGYNWMDLYPISSDGKPFEIRIPGRLRYLDLWVWGSNLAYILEAYVRDYQGAVHRIPMGNLAYAGWKNLRGNIPSYVRQSKRVLPHFAQLRFVKFRIWTTPGEKVDDFYIYIKQLKVLTDTFESPFDGDELSDPDYYPQLWTNSSGNSNQ